MCGTLKISAKNKSVKSPNQKRSIDQEKLTDQRKMARYSVTIWIAIHQIAIYNEFQYQQVALPYRSAR